MVAQFAPTDLATASSAAARTAGSPRARVATIIVVAGLAGCAKAPAADGELYIKE